MKFSQITKVQILFRTKIRSHNKKDLPWSKNVASSEKLCVSYDEGLGDKILSKARDTSYTSQPWSIKIYQDLNREKK